MNPKTVTVQELIEALQVVENKNAIVLLEGCDCIGPADGVVEEKQHYRWDEKGRMVHDVPAVLLHRTEGT